MNTKKTSILSTLWRSNRVFFALSLAFALIFNIGLFSLDSTTMGHSFEVKANPFLVEAVNGLLAPQFVFAHGDGEYEDWEDDCHEGDWDEEDCGEKDKDDDKDDDQHKENEAPTITLFGDNPIELTVGDTFADPGATASDPEDGDISSDLVIGGDTVDTSTAGTYTITYNVTDSDGTAAEEKTRTIQVNELPAECFDEIDNDSDGLIDLDDPGCESEEDNDETDKEEILGSISICKVIIDGEGNVIDGFTEEGEFTVDSIDVLDAVSTFGSAFFSGKLDFNEPFFEEGEDNAECVSFEDLTLGSYYYGEEVLEGDEAWQIPLYNDQFSTSVNTLEDFFLYSGELFTADTSDDASRNQNADGHIILTEERPDRVLVVLNQRILEEDENTSPVITLLGDNPIVHAEGYIFVDPGATAEDAEDGDITGDIVVGGDTVDMNTSVGTYTITYNVTDSDGAAADEVTRTVKVIPDPELQPLSECTDEEDNDSDGFIDIEDPACHTDGDSENEESYDPTINDENLAPVIILLGDNPTDIIVGDTFTDPGAEATDLEDGDITGDITVGGDVVDADTIGTYVITYNVADSEGKEAEEVARTVHVNPAVTECNDEQDNDGDELVDLDDPGCESEADNDENEKPTITLLGDNPIELTVGDTFADPGATATDPEDGDISDDIVIGGDTVSTTTAGTFVITYNVTDSDGADADEVTRTVNVNEPEPLPQCSDGIDNEGDGQTDFPDDPGCENTDDNDETDPAPTPTGGGGGGGGGGGPTGGTVISGPLSIGFQNSGGEVAGAVTVVDEEVVRQCPQYLVGFIKEGEQNDPVEVRKLQSFLRNFEGFPNVEVTGIYNEETKNAVDSFQEKYFGDILAPWGYDKATTYVYLTTRKKVNEIYCKGERAFPLTEVQLEEVAEFRAYLASLEQTASPQQQTPSENADVKDIIDEVIKDSVGEAENGDSQSAAVGDTEESGSILKNVRNNVTNFFNRLRDIF